MPLTILSILIFIFILGLLIAVHEFGHYIAAIKSGIRVTEFSIGMGPKIWKKQKGETLYSLRALPIGGFCNLGEDIDPEPEDTRAFPNAKRRWQALVLAAGSVMNIVLGFFLLLALYLFLPSNLVVFSDPVIEKVYTQSDDPNWTQPLREGDRILRLNGHAINNFRDFDLYFPLTGDGPIDLRVERDGQTVVLNRVSKTTLDGEKMYGISIGYQQKPTTLGARVVSAFHATGFNVRVVWVSLGELFGGRAKMTDLMGPVGMANVVDSQIQNPEASVGEKVMNLVDLAALIAINLAVMNLLPIPGLDGSRLLIVAVEGIRRKRLNPKYVGYVHAAGMLLLFAFMIFIFFNDIIRWITGGPMIS